MPPLDRDLDALYAAPHDGFVAARDELASRLRASGDRTGAATVAKLRKPSLAAWGLNQLAHRHARELGELIRAGEMLWDAQRRALDGRGADAADRLHEATDAHRREVARLAELALAAIGGSGSQREEIEGALQGAGIDPDVTRELQAGHIVKPPPPPMFGSAGVLALVPSADETEEPDADDSERAQRARVDRLRRELKAAMRTTTRLDERAATAQEEAERLATAAEESAQRAARARDEAAEATAKLSQIREAIAEIEGGR